VGAGGAVFEMQTPDIDIESESRTGMPFSCFARRVSPESEGRGIPGHVQTPPPLENRGLGGRNVLGN
jgi:hypothetical protein